MLAFGALVGTVAADPAPSTFQPGEILVNEFGSARIQRYSASGALLQTFTGTGTTWEGASLTPEGNLVTGFRSPSAGIDIFSPSGAQIVTFATVGNPVPGDVSVFADGTLALNAQGSGEVQFYSQTGTLLRTVSLPGLSPPFGSTIGADGILYVGSASTTNLARVDSFGRFLGLINLSFTPGDLVMNPLDGTLWVSGFSNHLVEHIQTDGTVLGSFATGLIGDFIGIGLSPDNNSLYVTATSSSVVKHFDLNGNLLDSFNLTSPDYPLFLSVVPAAAPEPGSATLLLGGLALLAARRRRASTFLVEKTRW